MPVAVAHVARRAAAVGVRARSSPPRFPRAPASPIPCPRQAPLRVVPRLCGRNVRAGRRRRRGVPPRRRGVPPRRRGVPPRRRGAPSAPPAPLPAGPLGRPTPRPLRPARDANVESALLRQRRALEDATRGPTTPEEARRPPTGRPPCALAPLRRRRGARRLTAVVTTGGPPRAPRLEMEAAPRRVILALARRFYDPPNPRATSPSRPSATSPPPRRPPRRAGAGYVAHAGASTNGRGRATPDGSRSGSPRRGVVAQAEVSASRARRVASSAPRQAAFAMPGYDRVVGRASRRRTWAGRARAHTPSGAAFRALSDELNARGTKTRRGAVSRVRHVFRRVRRVDRRAAGRRDESSRVFGGALRGVPRAVQRPGVRRAGVRHIARVRHHDWRRDGDEREAVFGIRSGRLRNAGLGRIRNVPIRNAENALDDSPSPPASNASCHLARLTTVVRAAFEGSCVDADHAAGVAALNATSVSASFPDYDRSWFWQTCAEFGFYQTCEDATCPFLARGSRWTPTFSPRRVARCSAGWTRRPSSDHPPRCPTNDTAGGRRDDALGVVPERVRSTAGWVARSRRIANFHTSGRRR